MALVCGLLGAWGLRFIWRSSFEVGGARYFCLFDDAMITMVYARNFVDGLGLEWARWGEPVEGFTHPLWLAWMIALNALGLPLALRSLLVQLSSLALLLLLLLVVRRAMRTHFGGSGAIAWLPAVVLTASYFPLDHWSLMGLETGLQALLIALAVHLTLGIVYDGRPAWARLGAVLAAAVLVRLDMALLALACCASLARGGALRWADRQRWLRTGLAAAALVAAVSGLRWWYFGDLLPNTYYLKMTGVPTLDRLARGVLELGDFASMSALPLALAVVGFLWLRPGQPRVGLPALVVALYLAYFAWIGGGSYPADGLAGSRFIAPVMPLVFLVLNASLNELRGRWRAAPRSGTGEAALVAGATLLCALTANGLVYGEKVSTRWDFVLTRAGPLFRGQHRELVRDLEAARRLLAPDAIVAVMDAGIPAYFSDFRMVDLLGYNDRHIARLDSRVPTQTRNWSPGHTKWDLDYVLETRPPDLFFPRRCCPHFEPEVLRAHGYVRSNGFWVLAASPRLRVPLSP